jgi:hypothetical protein
MEPLIDELVRAWEEGVWTYDRATKTNFKMHVWYQYSMHDLPAYGLFCAWCVHGKFPCPVCKEAFRFIWLKKGGKYSSFDKHRQFLPPDHPFRRHQELYERCHSDRPSTCNDDWCRNSSIDRWALANTEGGFVGYGEQHMWTHKSGLTRLPYYDDLLLPHNIDVMHTENNVVEVLWATTMECRVAVPVQRDPSMSAELRHVANGFAYRVKKYSGYDVNGYHFRTTNYDQSRPNRKTTCSGVFTPGLDEVDYFGRIEEMYGLNFHGSKLLTPVIFKYHWFDPQVTRRTHSNLGIVEIRQDSTLLGDDVYIMAQQATQVYYLPYACQTK